MSTEPPTNHEPRPSSERADATSDEDQEVYSRTAPRLSMDEIIRRSAELKEKTIREIMSTPPETNDPREVEVMKSFGLLTMQQGDDPAKEPGTKLAPFADADQMAEHFDKVIEEKKQAGMGRSFGPVQVARAGQSKPVRPQPPADTSQSAKPRSSAPKRHKGPRL